MLNVDLFHSSILSMFYDICLNLFVYLQCTPLHLQLAFTAEVDKFIQERVFFVVASVM